jgi:hypothetical protein
MGTQLSSLLLQQMGIMDEEEISKIMSIDRIDEISKRLTRENYITASLFIGIQKRNQELQLQQQRSHQDPQQSRESNDLNHDPFIDHLIWVRPFLSNHVDLPANSGEWNIKIGFFNFTNSKKFVDGIEPINMKSPKSKSNGVQHQEFDSQSQLQHDASVAAKLSSLPEETLVKHVQETDILDPFFYKSQSRMVQNMRPLSYVSVADFDSNINNINSYSMNHNEKTSAASHRAHQNNRIIDTHLLNHSIWQTASSFHDFLLKSIERAEGHVCIDTVNVLNFPYCGSDHTFDPQDIYNPYVELKVSVMGPQEFLSSSSSLIENFSDNNGGISVPKPVLVDIDYSFYFSHSAFMSSALHAGASTTAASISVDWMKQSCNSCAGKIENAATRIDFQKKVLTVLSDALQHRIYDENRQFLSAKSNVDDHDTDHAHAQQQAMHSTSSSSSSSSSSNPLEPYLSPSMLHSNVESILAREQEQHNTVQPTIIVPSRQNSQLGADSQSHNGEQSNGNDNASGSVKPSSSSSSSSSKAISNDQSDSNSVSSIRSISRSAAGKRIPLSRLAHALAQIDKLHFLEGLHPIANDMKAQGMELCGIVWY